jgi:Tol biopolymer transport system component
LAYAHAAGVVHRDVKPDNILMSGRHVFLADFGVAHALAPLDDEVTRTGTGIAVGTPAYMAPEQIASAQAGTRSDLYAWGVVAYELLTGAVPFTGSPQDVVVAQLTKVPDPVERKRPETPAALSDLVMKCLAKKPANRCQRADDLVPILDNLALTGSTTSVDVRGRAWRPTLALGVLTVVIVAGLAGAWYVSTRPSASPSLTIGRLIRVTAEPGLELDPAISPDGRAVAYAGGLPGQMRIYVRQITAGRSVAVTEAGQGDSQRAPVWSPDGSRLVFQSGLLRLMNQAPTTKAMLLQIPALGGTLTRVALPMPTGSAAGLSWSPDGRQIAFGGVDGIYVIAADGNGDARSIVRGDQLHSPHWSADGTKLAYVRGGSLFAYGEEGLGNVETGRIFVFSLPASRSSEITGGGSLNLSPVWMPGDRTLLFVSNRDGGRDVYSVNLTADGERDGEATRLTSGLNAHGISVSRDGKLLVYASYTPSANIWSIEILGKGTASVRDAQQVTLGNQKIEKLAVSKDGQWLAYDSDRDGQSDIWKVRLAGGTPELVTRGPNNKFVNDWSPDGQEIVFHSIREGTHRDVLVVSADGSTTEPVAATSAEEQHSSWGPDGNTIIYDSAPSAADGNQVYVATRAKRGAPWGPPRRLTSHGSSDPKWAPDGKLIAFCANGQLRTIAADGTNERVLVDGSVGTNNPEPAYPVWSDDSSRIYYKAYDRERQSSIWEISTSGGTPRLLVRFDDPARRSLRREFATDGKRFYFTVAREESDLWAMELSKK